MKKANATKGAVETDKQTEPIELAKHMLAFNGVGKVCVRACACVSVMVPACVPVHENV